MRTLLFCNAPHDRRAAVVSQPHQPLDKPRSSIETPCLLTNWDHRKARCQHGLGCAAALPEEVVRRKVAVAVAELGQAEEAPTKVTAFIICDARKVLVEPLWARRSVSE
jgi:hypothetical protein